MITTLLGAKLGAALAAGAVSFAAVGAAAYTGVLPPGLQSLAHTTIGAPAADQGENADGTTKAADDSKKAADDSKKAADGTAKTVVGPDATGHAAFGLCTAWAHVRTQGQVADKSVAFRNLATAAGGAGKITAYCATAPHSGESAPGKAATSPSGKPTSHPSGKPTSHPSGKPTSHPSGKPTSHPTGKPGETK